MEEREDVLKKGVFDKMAEKDKFSSEVWKDEGIYKNLTLEEYDSAPG